MTQAVLNTQLYQKMFSEQAHFKDWLLVAMLSDRYEVSVQPPPYGKNYNDYLCMRLGLPITHRKGKVQER